MAPLGWPCYLLVTFSHVVAPIFCVTSAPQHYSTSFPGPFPKAKEKALGTRLHLTSRALIVLSKLL